MKPALYSFLTVSAIAVITGLLGRNAGAWWPLAVIVPYAAIAVFLLGLAWRVVEWSNSPVPFRIPTVCGQQKSLAWIKSSRLESPSTTLGVIGRMALEILLFRSLFRNNRTVLREGPRVVIEENKYLWLGALAFHWSLLVILLRHLRLFVNPIPRFVLGIQSLDGFFQIGAPVLYATDLVILAALLYLLQRRMRDPLVRYISLFTDYFALFLLLGIVVSGIWMRYHGRVDVTALKQFAIGLATFSPIALPSPNASFFIHLALVSTLAAYFPFSKLVHMGGVFLSPTRNLANNNRSRRHVNPWDYPVAVHTYEEWEAEFHDKIAAAGLPLDRP
jgi:nitrate reductase gamma subunit